MFGNLTLDIENFVEPLGDIFLDRLFGSDALDKSLQERREKGENIFNQIGQSSSTDVVFDLDQTRNSMRKPKIRTRILVQEFKLVTFFQIEFLIIGSSKIGIEEGEEDFEFFLRDVIIMIAVDQAPEDICNFVDVVFDVFNAVLFVVFQKILSKVKERVFVRDVSQNIRDDAFRDVGIIKNFVHAISEILSIQGSNVALFH